MIRFLTFRVLASIGVMLAIMTVSFWMTRTAPGGPFDREDRLNSAVEANLWIQHGMADLVRVDQEGAVGSWKVKRGAEVGKGDVLLTLESGEAVYAAWSGILVHRAVEPGTVIQPGDSIGIQELPWFQQYMGSLWSYLQFEFGPSFQYPDRRVEDMIGETFPVSMELGLWSLILALILGLWSGVFAGLRAGSIQDTFTMGVAMLGVSLSTVVLGPLLLLVFAVHLQWFDFGGWSSASSRILPVITLGVVFAANIARLTRTSVIEVASSPFVLSARARGLSEGRIVIRHILPPALIPLLGYLGPACAALLCGSVVVERVFNVPGVSEFFISGALNRDYPLMMGVIMLYSGLLIGFNLVMDLLHEWLDPRVVEHD